MGSSHKRYQKIEKAIKATIAYANALFGLMERIAGNWVAKWV